ncbi:DUF2510 domain-containing protein [Microbacterium sp. zg.B48]|uniref:DUF2510 domain-containing protein n=1 Tax=Microbacterium sp. zg.B48 TaxID=2969408 RepID=UPI00214AECEB|nr:DUF2510 domain-containing protein [Microbacterium sp. zg.B48]MCR2762180.1 DUF2510 domain-containing protein [Microbacterium sp. zg.B48]
MASGAEAGWYDDGSGKQRWWDGTRWSAHYVDLSEPAIELRADAGPAISGSAEEGWYDDGRGRQRWWNGTRWTDAARFTGQERSLAGVVVDGRWLHFGALSEPAAGARASAETGALLLKRGLLGKPATTRTLFGPGGPITPRLLPRSVRADTTYLFVQVAGQVWLAPVATGQDREAEQFATWINTVSDHYRYRP